jgi:hypothetical protein
MRLMLVQPHLWTTATSRVPQTILPQARRHQPSPGCDVSARNRVLGDGGRS